MKRGSRKANNGYIGVDQITMPNSGIVSSNKTYNVGIRDLPFYGFGNTGNAFGVPDGNYVRPPEWPALPGVTAGSQQIVGLFAVYNDESNVCAVQIQGAYTVDWGDGTAPQNYATNTVATKRYDQTTYAGLTSSVVASRGNNYKTALIRITPQSGQNLTTVDFCATPTGVTGYSSVGSSQWLDIRMSAPNLTTLTVSKWYINAISNRYLELFEYVGQAALTSFNFISCFSLRKILAFPSTRTMGTVSWQSLMHTCTSLQEFPASLLDGSIRATNLAYFFYFGYNLKKLPIETWNIPACTTMEGTFLACANLNRVPQLVNTSNVTNFNSTFSTCQHLEEIPYVDTTRCTNFGSMFATSHNIRKLQDTLPGASGTNFSYMFSTTTLQKLPNINTSNGTNFQGFVNNLQGCLTIPQYDYSKATDLSFFARYSNTLKYLPDFNTTSALTTTSYMFDNAISLVACPNFSGFTGVNNTSFMFQACAALRTIPSITMGNVTTSTDMFKSTQTLASIGMSGISFSFALNSSTNNIMGPTALNNLYTSLATVGVSGANARTISVSGNWGYTASDRTIAIGKGWLVN